MHIQHKSHKDWIKKKIAQKKKLKITLTSVCIRNLYYEVRFDCKLNNCTLLK